MSYHQLSFNNNNPTHFSSIGILLSSPRGGAMTSAKVAVIGSGISGSVCASILARNGLSVALFDSARGPGGRMSQRREVTEHGKPLLFDHGAPFFTVNNSDVLGLVQTLESRGLVAQWKETFGTFDCASRTFVNVEPDQASVRYVGVPGMNSICKALCNEAGIESNFSTGVGKLEWLESEDSWLLTGLDGRNLGNFNGVVASDKNVVSPRFTSVTGQAPPLDSKLVPEMIDRLQGIAVDPCFALMLAFLEPLSSIPFKGFSIINSEVLRWAHCDSSKPGRSGDSDRWVLHSTVEYAQRIISETGLQKPSDALLTRVSEEIFQAWQSTGLVKAQPFHRKAHRWGSAFPAASIAKEEKCLWDKERRLAICGDFCVGPNVEGAIISAMAAASKFSDTLSCL